MLMIVELMVLQDSRHGLSEFGVRPIGVQPQGPTHPPLHSLCIQFGASTTVLFRFCGFCEQDTGITTGLVTFVSQEGDGSVFKWKEAIVGFF